MLMFMVIQQPAAVSADNEGVEKMTTEPPTGSGGG